MIHDEKRAIIVAPNGARKTKADHPAVPVSADEIAEDVLACYQAGAAMVHLHARKPDGSHSLDISDNLAVLEAVHSAVGDKIMVQLTTEAVGIYKPEQQMELIRETKPEAASFALKELIPDDSYLDTAAEFFHWVASEQIIAQYILYSEQDLLRYFSLLKSGLLPEKHHHTLIVLGRYQAQMQASPKDLLPFLREMPNTLKSRWAVCAFGRMEQTCLISAMLMGADVRIGFENNHMNNHGLPAKNNAHQISQLAELMRLMNIEKHNAESFRAKLVNS
ncbi:3-keto-5-aminohexanoate cleavage protein [Vibrio sp. SCSIO 43137]|uniref:3-keto-5-aminohexanoate cleavage protein n=1 Tax=Vibrio sp. SCSIO 43137 TaxID=3021011 RepID=UPI002307ECC8|nr:3-keto-5-aminohexanoate cleavage protein [Vibrio sp. SCSIO 43137]WCE30883.1 3-keto-5-aminohexanoate cleavage protein [Vibrio sp. SCSIO 43137]